MNLLLVLMLLSNVKFLQIFVAFSDNLNFINESYELICQLSLFLNQNLAISREFYLGIYLFDV